MVFYVPGTEETDAKKQNMSLQQLGGGLTTATTDIATNTTNIATNTAAIATLNAATYVNSFKARTGVVVPTQGDYPTSLIPGTTTNDNATAGNIGEFSSLTATTGTLTSTTATNITSLTLGAGDWDITAGYNAAGATSPSVTDIWVSINTVTATGTNTAGQSFRVRGMTLSDPVAAGTLGPLRASLSGSTTYYLNTTCTYTGGTFAVSGIIRARRVR